MYESHFGLTGSPFSLNPDPAFFFGSRGHTNALSYLKFGVYQGEGFVVVTGEIGAGKTTLVRTLLSELDSSQIVAAQIVSTQLEAGDLLRSVALAFGISPKTLSKAELIATIEAFLTQLVIENKRALLIVDEAQNLNREAVEELRMLSNFQLGNQALLQSFLVGQPELRVLLTSKPMEQFRQRVIASCHLGPMDEAETRAYIEHRLHQVGWVANPSFDDPAFTRIFHWTAGIPRRVNLLCNRLLLSAYLASQSHIDAEAVDAIGNEVRGEVGEAGPQLAQPVTAGDAGSATAPAAPALRVVPQRTAGAELGGARAAALRPPEGSMTQRSTRSVGPLMCVAASPTEDLKLTALLQALKRHAGLPRLIHVRLGDASRFDRDAAELAEFGVDALVIGMAAGKVTSTDRIAEVLTRFGPLVAEQGPSAIVVVGCSDAALACSLVANKAGCRLVHAEAGWRGRPEHPGEAVNSVLIDRLAELFYASEMGAYLNLIREGVGEANVEHAGRLPDDDAARKIAGHLAAWIASVPHAATSAH